MVRVTSLLARPGLFRTLVADVRVAARLMREPRVPIVLKALPVLASIYLISPLDFIPDVLPLLGQIDDLGIAVIALKAFIALCPSSAATFHREALAQGRRYSPMSPADEIIDAEFHQG